MLQMVQAANMNRSITSALRCFHSWCEDEFTWTETKQDGPHPVDKVASGEASKKRKDRGEATDGTIDAGPPLQTNLSSAAKMQSSMETSSGSPALIGLDEPYSENVDHDRKRARSKDLGEATGYDENDGASGSDQELAPELLAELNGPLRAAGVPSRFSHPPRGRPPAQPITACENSSLVSAAVDPVVATVVESLVATVEQEGSHVANSEKTHKQRQAGLQRWHLLARAWGVDSEDDDELPTGSEVRAASVARARVRVYTDIL
eukprot:COSAG02_NODE_3552_length_6575_cov_3.200432_2_plen_263_part_00